MSRMMVPAALVAVGLLGTAAIAEAVTPPATGAAACVAHGDGGEMMAMMASHGGSPAMGSMMDPGMSEMAPMMSGGMGSMMDPGMGGMAPMMEGPMTTDG